MLGRRRNKTKFLWFSGKGGTGKTSISCATAIELSERGHEVLVISTDPAHSLSDSLDVEIDGITEIKPNLDALEIDPEEEVENYKNSLQAGGVEGMQGMEGLMDELYEGMDIMKNGPGITEMAAFNRFMEHMNSDEYDVIVFDTAPTGHTLKLLRLPEVMDSMVGRIMKMRMRFSHAIDTFRSFLGQDSGDNDLEALEEMKRRIEGAREMLSDPTITSFNFVMLPEKMSIYETERAMDYVKSFGIPVGRIFVNQVIPENGECSFCSSRREMQEENLSLVRSRFDREIVEVPHLGQEVRGEDSLRRLASSMRDSKRQ